MQNMKKEKKVKKQKVNKDGQPILPSAKAGTPSAKAADRVTKIVGSWWFLGIQSVVLMFWVYLNIIGWIRSWDPYPFILLNLMLSFQAAYTAPIILMSQNRQTDIDRQRTEYDYMIDRKAEREIVAVRKELASMRRAMDRHFKKK